MNDDALRGALHDGLEALVDDDSTDDFATAVLDVLRAHRVEVIEHLGGQQVEPYHEGNAEYPAWWEFARRDPCIVVVFPQEINKETTE